MHHTTNNIPILLLKPQQDSPNVFPQRAVKYYYKSDLCLETSLKPPNFINQHSCLVLGNRKYLIKHACEKTKASCWQLLLLLFSSIFLFLFWLFIILIFAAQHSHPSEQLLIKLKTADYKTCLFLKIATYRTEFGCG